jgi:hypothetical protein
MKIFWVFFGLSILAAGCNGDSAKSSKGKQMQPVTPVIKTATTPHASIKPKATMETILANIRDSVGRKIKEGFESEDAIVQSVTDVCEDEYEGNDLKPHVVRITTELLQQHRVAQANWVTPTDCDKLDTAFANLEKQGIVARQNFACCQTCGHAEIGDEITNASKKLKIKGYTFYHMQDTEGAAETGVLYLAYGSISGKNEDTLAIGHAIVEAVRGVGLKVDWNGSLDKRICITGLDWKRRRK